MNRKRIYLANKKFGFLTVSHRVENYRKRTCWDCLCDCGTAKKVGTFDLTSGKSKSCGCFHKEIVSSTQKGISKVENSAARVLYSSYKFGAKTRNLTFSLTLEDFMGLTSSNCHYCGSSPEKITTTKGPKEEYKATGIDRKDSSLGYEIENCLPCCTDCNYSKRAKSYEDFISWIQRLIDFRTGSQKSIEVN